uniref:Uncharacterized protein n=1 Tax=Anguilla anguilla TaxID=7936 RepID=A0A0E9UY77_ANGAN
MLAVPQCFCTDLKGPNHGFFF